MKRVVLEVSCGLVYAILEELSKRHVSVSRSLAGLSSICPGCEEFMVKVCEFGVAFLALTLKRLSFIT